MEAVDAGVEGVELQGRAEKPETRADLFRKSFELLRELHTKGEISDEEFHGAKKVWLKEVVPGQQEVARAAKLVVMFHTINRAYAAVGSLVAGIAAV